MKTKGKWQRERKKRVVVNVAVLLRFLELGYSIVEVWRLDAGGVEKKRMGRKIRRKEPSRASTRPIALSTHHPLYCKYRSGPVHRVLEYPFKVLRGSTLGNILSSSWIPRFPPWLGNLTPAPEEQFVSVFAGPPIHPSIGEVDLQGDGSV